MAESQKTSKKIADPYIEIHDNLVSMTWAECNERGEEGEKKQLSWEDLHELGIEDWMIRAAIEADIESIDEYIYAEASVFHGIVEYPYISSQRIYVTPEVAEKLNSNGYEIVTGQPTQFACSDVAGIYAIGDHPEPVSENYVPDIPSVPDNPNMYIGDNVEDFSCRISHGQFMARPLIYRNPHNGQEYFFCVVCEKAGRKNPWHPYIVGNKEQGYEEQSVLTAIHTLGDGHSVYEIAKYCSKEFRGLWDKRKVLRICDKLSENGKITYSKETRNNRQVKLVFLDRANG